VKEQVNTTDKLSAGLRALPKSSKQSFSSTQAAWRFYNNHRVSLEQLSEPLLEAAHTGITTQCKQYGLCVHDWSRLNYHNHTSKSDRYQITHEHDVGYDLQSSLMVNDITGQAIAPVAQRLLTKDTSYASYPIQDSKERKSHLDEVTDCIHWIEKQQFAKPLVHIIDREADSIAHIRTWEKHGYHWLTRSRMSSTVEYQGVSMRCSLVVEQLDFVKSRKVDYKGQKCYQWIADTPIHITRKSKPSQKKRKQASVAGEPVDARLVVCQIRNKENQVVSTWLLITNVKDVCADTVALWYYWRWKIETWFKLLKGAGHNLESWQQETGQAIAKRLLVVSMACVVVWEIANAKGEDAERFRDFLIRLSGRQMKHGVAYTNPALLAGLWAFISMLHVLETYSEEELDWMKKMFQKIVV